MKRRESKFIRRESGPVRHFVTDLNSEFIPIRLKDVNNLEVNIDDSLSKPIKVKETLERLFPRVPPADDKKSYTDFLVHAFGEYRRCSAKNLANKAKGFPWFYAVTKLANKRLRKDSIFIVWLWLCVSRPWKDFTSFVEWGPTREEDFQSVLKILNDLEDRHGLYLKYTYRGGNKKIFDRYKKIDLVRMNLSGIFILGYHRLLADIHGAILAKRFKNLLKSGTLVTKREYQRKLRINSRLMDLLIKVYKEHGMIKTIKLQKNSIGIFYNPP